MVGKLWQIEVHLHRECYGNSENWQRNLAKCCNLPNSPNFLLPIFLLYGTEIGLGSYKQGLFTLDNTYTHIKETCKEKVYMLHQMPP